MSNQEHITWLEVFKGMPAYIAEGFRDTCAYWQRAHPVLWVIQIVYLILLVATFWFVVTYTVSILEGDAMTPMSSVDFWWIIFTPLTQVGALFLLWGVCGRFAKFIINKFNIPNPDE